MCSPVFSAASKYIYYFYYFELFTFLHPITFIGMKKDGPEFILIDKLVKWPRNKWALKVCFPILISSAICLLSYNTM